MRDYTNEIISSTEKQTMEGWGNLENIFKWYISQRMDVKSMQFNSQSDFQNER